MSSCNKCFSSLHVQKQDDWMFDVDGWGHEGDLRVCPECGSVFRPGRRGARRVPVGEWPALPTLAPAVGRRLERVRAQLDAGTADEGEIQDWVSWHLPMDPNAVADLLRSEDPRVVRRTLAFLSHEELPDELLPAIEAVSPPDVRAEAQELAARVRERPQDRWREILAGDDPQAIGRLLYGFERIRSPPAEVFERLVPLLVRDDEYLRNLVQMVLASQSEDHPNEVERALEALLDHEDPSTLSPVLALIYGAIEHGAVPVRLARFAELSPRYPAACAVMLGGMYAGVDCAPWLPLLLEGFRNAPEDLAVQFWELASLVTDDDARRERGVITRFDGHIDELIHTCTVVWRHPMWSWRGRAASESAREVLAFLAARGHAIPALADDPGAP